MLNETDSIIEYVTMSCTWQENIGFNNNQISLFRDSVCINNFPNLLKILPKEKRTFKGVVYADNSVLKNKDIRLGFILIRRQEISASIEFYDLLNDKIKHKKDILWSKPFNFQELDKE